MSKKDTKALPLSDTLRDLALLRASDIDLAALLPPNEDHASGEHTSVQLSTEFIQEARRALKLEVEPQGKLDEVRSGLEELLAKLE